MAKNAVRQGHCHGCGQLKAVRASDDRVREHKHPVSGTPCTGANASPVEDRPLTMSDLAEAVRAAAREVHDPRHQVELIVRRLQELVGPRLDRLEQEDRRLRGENASLVDLVMVGAALVFDEIESTSERDYASETLHGEALKLKRKHPRLRG